MFLRATIRHKDGKPHRYWSVVESRRVAGQRVVQRPLLYLGEINSSQAAAWRKSIAVLEEGAAQPRPLSLFAQDRTETLVDDGSIVRLRMAALATLHHPANGAPAGWRCISGKSSGWTSSGRGGFHPAAKAPAGT